jgi:transposase
MPTHRLVPDPVRLHLLSRTVECDAITLTLQTSDKTVQCPICGRPSSRVHSRYRRTPDGLPWQEIPASVSLWSRRFFCAAPECPRRIFTERLAGIAAPHARRTDRLCDGLRHVAFALGGDPSRARPTPRVLSVDDFAFRRGRTNGSILVRPRAAPGRRSPARPEQRWTRSVANRSPGHPDYLSGPQWGVRRRSAPRRTTCPPGC